MDYAADMRDAGATIEETEKWLLENRNHVHHQFFSTDLTFFRRSGRVSGAAATLATILGLCPIMRLCDEGRIEEMPVEYLESAVDKLIALPNRKFED